MWRSRSLRHGPIFAPGGFLAGVAFSADGTTLATAGSAGVKLWDAATGARARQGSGYGSRRGDVAFSADGALVAFAVRA